MTEQLYTSAIAHRYERAHHACEAEYDRTGELSDGTMAEIDASVRAIISPSMFGGRWPWDPTQPVRHYAYLQLLLDAITMRDEEVN